MQSNYERIEYLRTMLESLHDELRINIDSARFSLAEGNFSLINDYRRELLDLEGL